MVVKFTFALCVFLSVFGGATAQHLRHKGTLGISYAAAGDSLMNAQRLPDRHGILVKNVIPALTAAQLGIQRGDILVSINNTDSLYLFDFQNIEQGLHAQDPIAVTYIRNRRKSRAVGFVTATPLEATAGTVSYNEVPYQRGYLRSIIHRPVGEGRFPTVFYIQGADCRSINFANDSLAPVKQLVDGWVKAGFTVVRVEKPGVGESEGTKDCSRLTYKEEMAVFENALRTFKKLPFVDSTRFFLFGESLGGVMAPLICAQTSFKPAGIMVYGTVAKSWFEHMVDVFRKRHLHSTNSLQTTEIDTRNAIPLLYEWLVQGKSATDLLQEPNFEAILTSKENPLAFYRGTFFGRSAAFFSELNQQNQAQAWGQIAVPALALYGEFDEKGLSEEASKTIAELVNEVLPEKGTFMLLKGTDGSFAKLKSLEEYRQLQRSGHYPNHVRRNFNGEIVEETVRWMNRQSGR